MTVLIPGGEYSCVGGDLIVVQLSLSRWQHLPPLKQLVFSMKHYGNDTFIVFIDLRRTQTVFN